MVGLGPKSHGTHNYDDSLTKHDGSKGVALVLVLLLMNFYLRFRFFNSFPDRVTSFFRI